MTKAQHDKLRADLDDLIDRLKNGIKEDVDGRFVLVWTQRELDQAKDEAVRLAKFFSKLPTADE